MTKERAPLTVENALFRVLGAIGVEVAAEATGRSESYLRALSDPDKRECLSCEDALRLDLEHIARGHDGAPITETMALILDQRQAERFADQAELLRRTKIAISEGAEAQVALLSAAQPGASLADLAAARRETEQAIAAFTSTLPLVGDPAKPP